MNENIDLTKILENLNLPVEGVVNLSMWMYFFKDRNPNSAMAMNVEDGEYFIVNHGRNSYEDHRRKSERTRR